MATHHSVRRRICAPIEVVWQTLTDVERMPEWTSSMSHVHYVEGQEIREGARVRIKQARLPRATWTVGRVVPQRSFTWSSTSGGVTTTGDHVLSPRADAHETEVALSIRHEGRGSRLVGALTSMLTRRYLTWEIDGLATRSEARAREL